MATQIERVSARPVHAAGVHLRQRVSDGVWLLERNGRYLQLSPAARAIWQLCDGQRTWAQIAARYRAEFGVDGTAAIDAFAKVLEERGFFAEFEVCEARSSRKPTATATEAYVACSPEAFLEALYGVSRWTFHPLAAATFTALALAGAVTFVAAPRTTHVHGWIEQGALVLAVLASIAIHEAGHALMLRHFGGTVRRAGFGWYWFAPVAFVDTSDAYTLAREKRIAVSLAGPFASLVVAGVASLFGVFGHANGAGDVAWSLAAFTYVATLWNFNPLLELDGYYVLADLLKRPNLRRDAWGAVCARRHDSVALLYAGLALAYAAIVLSVTIPSVARMTIVAWLPSTVGEPLRSAIPIVAAVIAFLAVAHSHRSVLMQTIRHASVRLSLDERPTKQ